MYRVIYSLGSAFAKNVKARDFMFNSDMKQKDGHGSSFI